MAAGGGAIVVSFGENRGLRAGIAAGYREAAERGYAFCGRVDADGQHPVAELARLLELVRADACDVAVGSRFAAGEGYDDERYSPSASRRFGIGLLQKAMHIRLGRPFHDPTSGMAAVNAKAMPVMAEPYVSGAPEVEALLRLKAEGLRVEEVAVHMRERASGESKLQGKKAVKLVRHGDRHVALLPLAPPPPVVSGRPARVVVVLGYADGGRDALHPVAAARLARAAEISTDDDVVVLSGWARVPGTRSEAELMAAAWTRTRPRARGRPRCANDGRERCQRPR